LASPPSVDEIFTAADDDQAAALAASAGAVALGGVCAVEVGRARARHPAGAPEPPFALELRLHGAAGETIGALRLARELPFDEEARGAAAILAARLGVALAARRASSSALRDEFVAVAAHELRTPITALVLQLEALRRTSDGRAAMRVASMARQLGRLERLVDALLDVERIGAGWIDLHLEEDVDLAAIAREVAERFADQMSWAGCALVLDADHPVVGRWDRVRVDQAVTNLVANAVKYGHGRPIEISVASHEARGRVVIRDHGVGIDGADQARIFDRFERAHPSFAGFGLGLWIVRRIAAAHGGQVVVSSEPGLGSTFTLDLPRRAAAI
jgi:signal transduction histidine kinase